MRRCTLVWIKCAESDNLEHTSLCGSERYPVRDPFFMMIRRSLNTFQNSSGRTFRKSDFVREGLKIGLKHEQALGENPFEYGFAGGTDNHNGLMSDVAEAPLALRRRSRFMPSLKTATYSNDIGSGILLGSWTDPDFNPEQAAFYYARALEIPAPRWSTYDAVRNGLPLLEDVPAVIQELAREVLPPDPRHRLLLRRSSFGSRTLPPDHPQHRSTIRIGLFTTMPMSTRKPSMVIMSKGW